MQLNTWRFLALTLVAMLAVLGGGFAIQAAMLHWNWSDLDMGSLPDWLAGVGAVVTSASVVYAALEWHRSQSERRDREIDQARLVLLQTPDPEDFRDESIVVRNYSAEAIYDVQVFTLRYPVVPANLTLEEFLDEVADPTEAYAPMLPPGGTTVPPLDVTAPEEIREQYSSSLDFAAVAFTDAQQRRWWRFGKGAPIRATPEWSIRIQ